MVFRTLILGLVVVMLGGVARAQEAGAPDAYLIGPQDVVTISVFSQPTLSGRYQIDTEGMFAFPLIGRVSAAGHTSRQLEADLTERLREYYQRPQVSVAIDQFKSRRLFIVGEVRSPGAYPMSGAMSLVEAIALAGSALPSASGQALLVHARGSVQDAAGPTLPVDGNAADTITIDLDALQRGEIAQNIVLRDGDTIFVPRAQTVFVFGQVKNPGAYPVQKGTTVLQALSLAGGVSPTGALNRVRIERMEKGRKVEAKIKLDDMVQPGDTIVIPERMF